MDQTDAGRGLRTYAQLVLQISKILCKLIIKLMRDLTIKHKLTRYRLSIRLSTSNSSAHKYKNTRNSMYRSSSIMPLVVISKWYRKVCISCSNHNLLGSHMNLTLINLLVSLNKNSFFDNKQTLTSKWCSRRNMGC